MEHIHKAVYINLDRRDDRRGEIETEMSTFGISGERFPAIHYDPGIVGCGMSHLAVLERAKREGWENVLILEDDFMFVVTKEVFEQEIRTFFDLHIPYDVLMISYNLRNSAPYNATVCRTLDVQTTSGYIVHNRFYDTLIQNFKEGLEQLIHTGRHWDFAIDQYWKRLQPDSEWFCMNRRIGRQRPGFSDLAKRFVSYDDC